MMDSGVRWHRRHLGEYRCNRVMVISSGREENIKTKKKATKKSKWGKRALGSVGIEDEWISGNQAISEAWELLTKFECRPKVKVHKFQLSLKSFFQKPIQVTSWQACSDAPFMRISKFTRISGLLASRLLGIFFSRVNILRNGMRFRFGKNY